MSSAINHATAIYPVPAVALTILDDTSTSGVEYVGYASPVNSAGLPASPLTSAAVWAIMKITVAAGLTTTQWAKGSPAFQNVWDDRADLTYY